MKRIVGVCLVVIITIMCAINVFAGDTYTFQEALSYKNSHRKISGPVGISQYLKHHSGEVNITQEEINALATTRPIKNRISQAEAISDVDLLFRALKYGYGCYYYFGEQNFENAKNAAAGEMAQKSTLTAYELESILHRNLSFVMDSHFGVGMSPVDVRGRYQTYYCNIPFAWDSDGYYILEGDTKWYYQGADNANVKMQYFMSEAGELYYSPIQFCIPSVHSNSSIITLSDGNATKSMNAVWKNTQPYMQDACRVVDYKQLESNGIVYISYRNCDISTDETQNQFINGASSARNAKLVIIDIRSNGGGDKRYSQRWAERFTGQQAATGGAITHYRNALEIVNTNEAVAIGSERYDIDNRSGNKLSNSIPVIILTDNMCGSAGEWTQLVLNTIDNAIVMGCNSNGCLLGSAAAFHLPNSGISARFGTSLFFFFKEENIDGKGLEPDIWCNPKTVIPALCNMLKNNGLADDATIATLRASGMN